MAHFRFSTFPLGSAAWLCQEPFRSALPLGFAKNLFRWSGVVCEAFLLSLLFVACTTDSTLPPSEDLSSEATVTLMVSANGLGDNGYNDAAADGVFAFAQQSGVHLRLLQPHSGAEAQTMFSQWMADNADTDSAVLILASSEYEAVVRNLSTSQPFNLSTDTGRRVLLFESDAVVDGISTVMISRYGVSWLAGAMSQGFDALILAAAQGVSTLDEAIEGFRDARSEYAGETYGRPCTTTLHYLASDASGFAMPDSAYRYVARRIDQAYAYDEMIFPLLGGSVTGLLRCLNDDDLSSALMIGMDVDMTGRCARLPFSVVIRIGDVVRRYLDDWRAGREWPQHQRLGMSDGAADIVITPKFSINLDISDDRYNNPDIFLQLYNKYKALAPDHLAAESK